MSGAEIVATTVLGILFLGWLITITPVLRNTCQLWRKYKDS